MALSNPAWAQQASSALAAVTRERVELQRAIVEAEDSIVRCVRTADAMIAAANACVQHSFLDLSFDGAHMLLQWMHL